MMFSVNVTTENVEDRLDAGFYHPNVLRIVEKLRSTGSTKLEKLIQDVNCGPFGGNAVADDLYEADGIPFIRPVNISGNRYAPDANLVRVTEGKLRSWGLKIYEGDNLFFGRVGDPCVAFIRGKVSISPNIIIAISKTAGADCGYLHAFCSGAYGIPQLERGIKQVTQPTTSTDSVRAILVLNSSPNSQTYIGEKVRQAERMRDHARTLELGFADTIRVHYPEVFGEPKAFGRSSRVIPSDLRRDLNPGAFNPERLRVRAEIKKAGGRELAAVASIEASVTDSFSPDDNYIGLDSISSSSSQLAPSKVSQAEIEGAARVLREGPVISKLRPYLNKVGYIPTELAGAVGSTELLCVRPNPGISGWFIYGVLKLSCTVRQFQPLANGSTLPRIDSEDVLEVMIPWHDDADRLGQDLERAQAMYFAAEKLTTAAMLLVEALIEGKVTEAELVAAQEALERGDATADRALLRRLTRHGLDVPGQPPLFPDLDALYTLLAQTAAPTE